MAQYPAIATLGQAIIKLLMVSRPVGEVFDKARFELYQVENFAKPMEEGISLYLYRIGLNAARRNLPLRIGLDGRRYRAPLPLDLHYLLTAWGKSSERQLRLLGWAMRLIEDTPLLSSGLLNDIGPEPEIFFPNETVELVFDPLSLQDMYSIWSIMKVSQQPSASYVARAVALDSINPLTEAPPVQTRVFDYVEDTQG
jgi:hypothetical protein